MCGGIQNDVSCDNDSEISLESSVGEALCKKKQCRVAMLLHRFDITLTYHTQ